MIWESKVPELRKEGSLIVALEGWDLGSLPTEFLKAEKNLCPDPKVWGCLKYFRILTNLCDDHKSPFAVGNLDGTMSALSLVSVPGKNLKTQTGLLLGP